MATERKQCAEPGCENIGICRGLCIKHYNLHKDAGTLPPKKPRGDRRSGARAARATTTANGGLVKRIQNVVAERDRYKAEADGLRSQLDELQNLLADTV